MEAYNFFESFVSCLSGSDYWVESFEKVGIHIFLKAQCIYSASLVIHFRLTDLHAPLSLPYGFLEMYMLWLSNSTANASHT